MAAPGASPVRRARPPIARDWLKSDLGIVPAQSIDLAVVVHQIKVRRITVLVGASLLAAASGIRLALLPREVLAAPIWMTRIPTVGTAVRDLENMALARW